MLTNDPCPEVVASRVAPAYRDSLLAAKAVVAGKPFYACWVMEPERAAVHLIYEDGDEGMVSVLLFHDEPAI
jgi:hypothetical protein